jgi:hypothetical protein
MKQLLIFLILCLGCIQLFGQKLVLLNKITKEKTTIWLEQVILIQTLDDPAGYRTSAIVHNIRDTVILLRKGKARNAQVIEIPLSHINNIYLPSKSRAYLKTFWLLPGFLLGSSGVILTVFWPQYGPLFFLAGLPLLYYGGNVVPSEKWHLANCEIIVNR